MMAEELFVGLDVGGTTMKAAVVDGTGQPKSVEVVMETHPQRGQDAGLETMCETIRQAIAAAKVTLADIAAIGVATPGLMDIHAGLILDPPNLKPWRNVPVRDHIHKTFNKLTAFENDANAATYGEYWVGAGRDADSLVMFTLGTGVGGGIIVDDRVIQGKHSHGGELGHLRIDMPDRGRLCGCGARGCLEAYGSATSIVARTREDLASYRAPTRLRGVMAEKGAEFTTKDLFDAAIAGDGFSRKVIEDTAYYLALGACAAIATVDPQMIVFGGGVMNAQYPFLELIEEYVGRYGLRHPAKHVQLRRAEKGSDAGYIGAAGVARQLYQSKK
ncbi:MAG: ROK family protein [Gemmataceae bacterium]